MASSRRLQNSVPIKIIISQCILLITLGVGGIVCDLADGGVSQVVLTRVNLAQGELSERLNSLAGISRLCGPGT